jgi:hypothetical protein
MLKPLSAIDQITFSDLVDKAHDANFDVNFPPNGTFQKQIRDGRSYWYYRGYERPADGSKGISFLKYAGPTSDQDLTNRIERFGTIKADYRVRRDLASKLRRAGLPTPLPIEGAVVQALAQEGLFRLRATLIGSVAYQTYAGLLAVRFSDANYRTQDLDIAQFHSISILIDDKIDDIGKTLANVDPTFAPVFDPNSPNLVAGYRNKSGFKVEILTPNRSRPENESHLAEMPALGGVGAQPLRYLDFLIHNPVRSVLLHEAGIGVMVPDPSRYAIHKLIITSRRRDIGKATKDINQSSSLIEALIHNHKSNDLGVTWKEAWARGPSWRYSLAIGALRLSDQQIDQLKSAVITSPQITNTPIANEGFYQNTTGRNSLTSFVNQILYTTPKSSRRDSQER